jgi:hypothetical protein
MFIYILFKWLSKCETLNILYITAFLKLKIIY